LHDKIVQRLAAEDGEPDLNLIPAHNVLDAIVMFAQTGNVDTVFIAGKNVKEDGRLLRPDSDLSTKKNQLIETGRRLNQGRRGVGSPNLMLAKRTNKVLW